MDSAVEIVRANVFELVAPLASVAVTMKLAAAADDAGVTVIAPVDAFNVRPDGKDGEIE